MKEARVRYDVLYHEQHHVRIKSYANTHLIGEGNWACITLSVRNCLVLRLNNFCSELTCV